MVGAIYEDGIYKQRQWYSCEGKEKAKGAVAGTSGVQIQSVLDFGEILFSSSLI